MSLPRLRAPTENGGLLAYPPLAAVGDQIEGNRLNLAQAEVHVHGVPLRELRRRAVSETVAAAEAYLRAAGEPVPVVKSDSLLVAGHQPELVHPGVWLKHFALNALAGRHDALSLNLVVDNDTAKTTAIRLAVPGTLDDPRAVQLATVPFDHFAGEVVYEERPVIDEAQFASFPRRVAALTDRWGFAPILPDVWDEALRQGRRTRLLGERIAAARRMQERRWGCHNLEVPMSHLCRTETFALFVCDLLDRLPEFHLTYNDGVHDYRRRHGIRSRNHPVPDLARNGDWLEAPFWAWRSGATRRGRLFVRPTAGGWQLRGGGGDWPDVPRRRAPEYWLRLEEEGYKVRTRALTTTLFARLLLADLFIHGIGGGKYDELTNTLFTRYYKVEPPTFLVLTGTLHLPLPTFPATIDDLRAQQRSVRDLYWNAQRHLPADAAATAEVQTIRRERTALEAERPVTPAARLERCRKFRAAGDRLRPLVAAAIASAEQGLTRLVADVAANAVLRRRDYTFCLFPELTLRPFLTQVES